MRDKYPEQSFALDRFRDIRESCSLPPMFFFDESPYHLVVVGMSFSWFENRNSQARAMMFDDHEDIAFRDPAKIAVVAILVLLKVDGPYLIKGECLSTPLFEGCESRGNRCELEWFVKTCH